MKVLSRNPGFTFVSLLSACVLAGCGGTKVLKEPLPLVVTQPLATASDERLVATLQWVIVRDGPGTWARNADWDEYMIGIRNVNGESLQVSNVIVVDSLGTEIEPRYDRKSLVKGTRKAKRRYKGEGLKVKAGLSGTVLLGASAVTAASLSGAGTAAVAGGGAAAGAVAVVALIPVLAVGGALRGINNIKVDIQIESRQALLPVVLPEDEEKNLILFFPLSPSPQRIEISYVDNGVNYTLILDTQAALDGLHLVQAKD